jgi:hypothetical protein
MFATAQRRDRGSGPLSRGPHCPFVGQSVTPRALTPGSTCVVYHHPGAVQTPRRFRLAIVPVSYPSPIELGGIACLAGLPAMSRPPKAKGPIHSYHTRKISPFTLSTKARGLEGIKISWCGYHARVYCIVTDCANLFFRRGKIMGKIDTPNQKTQLLEDFRRGFAGGAIDYFMATRQDPERITTSTSSFKRIVCELRKEQGKSYILDEWSHPSKGHWSIYFMNPALRSQEQQI